MTAFYPGCLAQVSPQVSRVLRAARRLKQLRDMALAVLMVSHDEFSQKVRGISDYDLEGFQSTLVV